MKDRFGIDWSKARGLQNTMLGCNHAVAGLGVSHDDADSLAGFIIIEYIITSRQAADLNGTIGHLQFVSLRRVLHATSDIK